MSGEELPRCDFARAFEAADVSIAQDGDGRTVDAWITPFDRSQEIRDAQGHYHETIGNTAFSKTLSERGTNFAVLFNHGRTFDGRTDGSLMVPIGVPKLVEARSDGLFSSTRYLDNPLADGILDGIKQGAIRGYSYSGMFVKSQRSSSEARGGLPVIHRSEIAMREYGPVLFPAHSEAVILGSRSAGSWLDELRRLDPEDLDALRQLLGVDTPDGAVDTTVTPPGAGPSDRPDPALVGQSRGPVDLRQRIAARNRARGVK